MSSLPRGAGTTGGVRYRRPWARIVAWLIDWCGVTVWAGLVAAIGVPLYRAGVLHALPDLAANVLSAVVLVVPVTVACAALETRRGGTVGKRVMRLRVTSDDGAPIGWSRALARNGLKIAVPWLVGHAAVYAITGTDAAPGWAWVLTGAAYVLPVGWILSLFVGPGWTPYDRLTRTRVGRIPTGLVPLSGSASPSDDAATP